MTLLDPVCRELLGAIGAALDVGDRPKDRFKPPPGRTRRSTAPGWSPPSSKPYSPTRKTRPAGLN